MSPSVTIVVPTRNRAESLRETLAAIGRTRVPSGWHVDLVVVDNGSTDHTANVACEACLPIPLTYLREMRKGVAHARNTGLENMGGDIALFIDDDLTPSENWIEEMCRPIVQDQADAVAGGVRLAPHLLRPWMDLWHRAWLASSECLDPLDPGRIVSANAAIRRTVLQSVPRFDPELGAGALGMAEETLFSMQLRRAGFRIVSAEHALCIHNCDEDRLTRSAFLEAASKLGRSDAYIAYHWEHLDIKYPIAALARARARLAFYRARHAFTARGGAPVAVWEMQLVRDVHFALGYLEQCERPRNYEKYGLLRLDEPGKAAFEARQVVNAS